MDWFLDGPMDCAELRAQAHATSPDGRALDVILHVIAGRLVELEIWAGSFGGDPRIELPDTRTLSR